LASRRKAAKKPALPARKSRKAARSALSVPAQPVPAVAAAAHTKPHLTGATFYRLKEASAAGPITDSDEYVEDLARSPLIQEVREGDSVLRLYGYENAGKPPAFAAFLTRFDRVHPPRVPRCAYLLIMRVLSDPECFYAVAFGAGGRYLLKDELIDVDAHRDVVQSETLPTGPGEAARLKQIRTRRIGANTTLIQRRSSRASTLGEINVDTLAEIVDEVDGAPKSKEKFGSALSGGQGLTVRRHVALEDLPGIASDLEASYRAAAANAGAVRGTMFPVKDKGLLLQLDDALATMVRVPGADDEIGFAVPDFIRAEDEPEVRFTKLGHGSPRFSDVVRISDYREALIAAGILDEVTVEYLRAAELVIGGDDGGKGRRFSVYRCLTALVEIGGLKYVHYDRSWYGIPANVLAAVDEQLAAIPLWDGVLPTPAARITEPAYNTNAGKGEYLLMDARLATPVPGQTVIEVCDLFTIATDGGADAATFVHVKRDFSSSSLSHLFEQGRVSAFLLHERAERAAILKRVQTELRGRSPKPSWSRRVGGLLGDAGFQARNVRVVYAIVGDWDGGTLAERLPFFSKIALVEAAHMLRGREFDVRVARIQMAGPTYPGRRKRATTRKGVRAGAACAPKAVRRKAGRKKTDAAPGARKKALAATSATRKKAHRKAVVGHATPRAAKRPAGKAVGPNAAERKKK
jgi:uncharacterized protein (TIGR04141 family)